jgi:hypothetical protein
MQNQFMPVPRHGGFSTLNMGNLGNVRHNQNHTNPTNKSELIQSNAGGLNIG